MAAIEVLTLAIPNVGGGLIEEPYILLDLGQLNAWEAGPKRTSAFQVFWAAPRVNWWPTKTAPEVINSDVALGLIVYDKKSAERSPTILYPARPRLTDLNITLRNRVGEVLDLGSDADENGMVTQSDCQWSMSLKITCATPSNLASVRFGN